MDYIEIVLPHTHEKKEKILSMLTDEIKNFKEQRNFHNYRVQENQKWADYYDSHVKIREDYIKRMEGIEVEKHNRN